MTILRTLLFAPANHSRKVEKSFFCGADAVILDLEDACAISEKVQSRKNVKDALSKNRMCKGYVRVNQLNSEFLFGDLQELIFPGLDGIILPKAESEYDVKIVDWIITQLENIQGIPTDQIDLIPIIENARGLRNAYSIAVSSERIKRLSFGAGDFTLDLGMKWSKHGDELFYARSKLVIDSRDAEIEPPIDTVFPDIKDKNNFTKEAQFARDLGYQGKLIIHPDQVPVANDIFSPSAEDVEYAMKIIKAFEESELTGSASIQVEGQFIDYPIAERAKKILQLHTEIQKTTEK